MDCLARITRAKRASVVKRRGGTSDCGMSQRRVLVIGSQCEELGRLSFLPEVAEDLYEVMTDPARGQCAPALEMACLLDASVAETKAAIRDAFSRASEDEATLFVAFIGHGEVVDDSGQNPDFYFLPRDASSQPDDETAVNLTRLISQLRRKHSTVDGLVVLLDTCHSGAAVDTASSWLAGKGIQRFELLTASDYRKAADGCFTRTLVELMKDGMAGEPTPYVRCEHATGVLEDNCPNQEPDHLSRRSAPELFLSINRALARQDAAWTVTEWAAEVERLTAWFQPTAALEGVVDAVLGSRSVAIVGSAGQGKSSIAAAMARPEVAEGLVPDGLVHAVAFFAEDTTSAQLADRLARQLTTSVPDFERARAEFYANTPPVSLEEMDVLHRELIGPLARLDSGSTVGLLMDGLDRLPASETRLVSGVLNEISQGGTLEHVRLIVTSRPDTPLPEGSEVVLLDDPSDASVEAYLVRREVPLSLRSAIRERGKGNWLVISLLADLACKGDLDPDNMPEGLSSVYDQILRRVG